MKEKKWDMDGKMEHASGITWYSDGTAEMEGRNGSNVPPSCGCAQCGIVYTGKGMLMQLLGHVNSVHGLQATTIRIDGGMVIYRGKSD